MFIIAGPPGAGKTTQCKLLEEELEFKWISAGNLLRQKATGKAKETMLEGGLVDDDYVDKLVAEELDKFEDHSKILLDGFPRDFYEARWLSEEYGANIKAYIMIELDEKIIRQRLSARGRADDTDEVITERLEVFHEETEPVIEYFDQQLIPVIRVNGNEPVEHVQKSIRQAMGLDE